MCVIFIRTQVINATLVRVHCVHVVIAHVLQSADTMRQQRVLALVDGHLIGAGLAVGAHLFGEHRVQMRGLWMEVK